MKAENNPKAEKKGFFTQKLTWWQILLGLLFAAFLTYSKVQEQLNSQASTSIGSNALQISEEEILKDLEKLITVMAETSSANELKEKSAPLLAELEQKYKGNAFAETTLPATKKFVFDEIYKREAIEAK